MDDLRYFGTYARFETESKKDAAVLIGADSLVGDLFDIEFDTREGRIVAWIVNKFGARVCYIDGDVVRDLNIARARSWNLRAILSFVAFTDTPDPGFYWGQVAIICNDPRYDEAVDAFVGRVQKLLADGVRPDVDLGAQGIDRMLANDGSWMTESRVPFPEKTHGTVILKSRLKTSEKLIEQGRKGNKGCYMVSWAFLILVAAAAVYGLHAIGLF